MWLFSLSSRRIAIIVFFLSVSTFSFSQNSVSIGTTSTNPKAVLWLNGTNQGIIIPIVSNKTSVSAGPTEKGMVIFDDSDKKVYFYDGTAWNQVGGSGAAGSQGIAINGNTVQLNSTAGATFGLSNTAPTGKGQLLVWDGTKWDATLAPTTTGQTLSWDNTNGKWTLANASLTLAGDVSGPSNNTTIASTSGNNIVAALNNASTTSKILPAQITAGTPNQVLTTSAGNVAVWANLPTATGTVTNIATGTGLTGGPITTTGTIALANTSVAPATYGSTTQIPQITVDAQGRITNATNVTPPLAGAAASGFLSAADWNTFNNKLSTESDPTVKAINGLVKSNGTTIGAVVSGTDIKTINGASILGAGNITALTAETDPTVKSINGIVKSNGTTISAATAGTDYVATETDPSVKAINGLVKSNGTTIGAVVSGTDIKTINGTSILGAGNITAVATETDPTVKSINGLVKSNGTTISAAVPGTDYLTANQTIILSGDLSGSGTTAITTSIGATAGNSIVTAINNAGTLSTINDNRLATITSVGKVNGGAITTGTIGGNTAINSTGNIATTGTLAAGATTVSGLTVTGATTSINGASLTWPASNLAGVLTNDGTGALTWAPSSVVSPANKVISGNATGTAQVASSIFDDGTYTAVGRTVPVSASGRFEIDATGFGSNAYGGMNLMTDNQGSPYYGYGNNGGSRMWTYYHGLSGSWRVWNGGTERLTITSTGDIGIGTTTPVATLDIVGNIKIADGTQGLGKVLTSDANGLASWQAVAGTGTVTSVSAGTGLTGGPITSSGSLAVDVGTTANKIVQLDGTGKLPAVDGSQLINLPAGTETDPTVKAINGIVKSNGTTISAAIAGTDFQAPLVSGTNIKTINGTSVLGAGNITAVTTETDPAVKAINGLVKSDGTTIGAVVSGTDVKTINGTSILGAGNITAVTTETDPTVKAINGLVKSNGTTISAATAGTDYLAPNGNGSALTNLNASNLASGTVPTARIDVGTTANKIVQLDATGKLPAVDGSQLTNLPAAAETDPTVKAINGLVKSNGTTITAATPGTDYVATEADPTVKAINGLVKSNGTTISAAVPGTDYLTTNQNITLSGDITGSGTTAITTTVSKINGSTWPANASGSLTNDGSGNLTWVPSGGSGTVTSITKGVGLVSGSAITTSGTIDVNVGTGPNQIVQLDGTGKLPAVDGSQLTNLPAGTETDPTVKAINGLVKSNGTAISAAVAGTDYVATETDPAVKAINGIVKSNGTTLSAVVSGTDIKTINGASILGAGNITAITSETDPTVTAINGLVKSNGTTISAATAGTDYLAPNGNGSALTNLNASNISSGTLALANGGTGATTAPAARTALGLGTLSTLSTVTSTEITDGTIANADVNASAAIAGSKINPSFGAQPVSTTSTLTTGSAGQFVVDATGNITKINNITTSFPATQGAANSVLTNDGAGNLTWATGSGWGLSGNALAGGEKIGSTNGNPLPFITNNVERMRIDPSGNVGIGTTAPTQPLHVAGPEGQFLVTPNLSGPGATSLMAQLINTTSKGPQVRFAGAVGGAAFNDIGQDATGNFVIEASDVPLLTLNENGALGVGSTPSFGTSGFVLTSNGTGGAPTWQAISGTGTVTSVAAGTGLTGGPITTSGTLAVDVGTTANKIVQLDGTGKLPAVDGSQLTNLPAGTETDPTVKAINGLVKSNGTTISAAAAGTDYQAPLVSGTNIKTINGASVLGAGNITAVTTETDPTVTAINGLVKSNGTTISAATAGTDYLAPNGNGSALTNLNASNLATGTVPTARIDVGTTANKIVQLDATGKLPAIDGSQLTNLPTAAETDPTVKAINGLVKSNGTTISAAAAGTDYLAPNGNGSALTNLNATNISSGTLAIANGGTGATTAPAARTALGLGTLSTLSTVTSSEITDGTIVDADINGTANINGAKINPSFGAQAVSTTSTLTTGSTGQFVVDVTGNITKINNIATSFPATQGAANSVLTNDGAGNLTWTAGSTTTASNGITKTGNDFALGGVLTGQTDINRAGNDFNIIGSGNFGVRTGPPGTDRLFVDGATGNVGIGTIGPSQALSVSGGIIVDHAGSNNGVFVQSQVLQFGTGSGEGIGSSRQPGQETLDFYTGAAKQMTIKKTGNIGIGTDTPLTPLQIGGSLGFVNAGGDDIMAHGIYFDGSNFINRGANANSAILLGDGKAGLYTFPAGTAAGVASSPNMRFNVRPTGVGIQVDNPIETFQVNGATYLNPITAPSTTTDRLYNVGGNLFWNGINISSGGSGWSTTGNAGTVDGTNFIGTTDDVPVNFLMNGQKAGRIERSIGGLAANTFYGYQSGNVNTTGWFNTGIGYQALSNNTTGTNNTAQGWSSLLSNTTGGDNTAFGSGALVGNTTGSFNTVVGSSSFTDNTIGNNNTSTGWGTLSSNTTGNGNTASGYSSMFNSTTGANNTAYGNNSLLTNTTGNNNTVVGSGADVASNNLNNATAIGADAIVTASNTIQLGNSSVTTVNVGTGTNAKLVAGQLQITGGTLGAGRVLTSDASGNATWQNASSGWGLTGTAGTVDGTNFIGTTDNVPFSFKVNNQKAGKIDPAGSLYLGYLAGNATTATVPSNTGIGSGALQSNTTGAFNTATGSNALQSNSTGSSNTAFGSFALNFNTTGVGNTAMGPQTLQVNTTGNSNTGIGAQSLQSNTIGSGNTAIGLQTLQFNTTGGSNTAVGYQTLNASTASQNTAVGYQSMLVSTTAIQNVALGHSTLLANLGGSQNSAIGYAALRSNTSGNRNMAFGMSSLDKSTTGSDNLAMGYQSLFNAITASNNVAIGSQALSNTTANNNVAIGVGAGTANVTGVNNTYLGNSANASAIGWSNSTAIGANAQVGASNVIVLGSINGVNGATADTNVGIGTTTPGALLDIAGATNGMRVNSWLSAGASVCGIGYVGTNLYRNASDNVWKFTNTNGTIGGTAINFADCSGTPNQISFVRALGPSTANANATVVESMRIDQNGRVGIGIAPAYPLDVSGGAATSITTTFFNSANGGGLSVNENQNPTIAVRAFGGFLSQASGFGGGFYVTSDERIKRKIGVSNSKNDLSQIMKIKVTDYKMRDSLSAGNQLIKGLIAQEVEAVYPQAVTKQTNFIPNVYAMADRTEFDDAKQTLRVTMIKAHNLAVGDKVKLISSTGGEKPSIVASVDGNTFTVSNWTEKCEKVFVFGKEVNDFRIVDYDRLFTLNISATQELVKLVEEQKKVIDELKAKEEENKKKIALLEASLNKAATSENELASLKSEIEKIKAALGLTVDAALPKKEEKK